MKNYKFRADSYGSSFFPPYLPTTFASLTCAPRSVDDRERPAFFTGHIDVRNDIFRYMPARYVVVTILRDPVDRIVSHYRFNSTQQSIFQDAIRDEGLDVLGYFERLGPAIPQQYEIFAPAKIGSESERVATALYNLEQFVTFFGLQERYEEFVSSAAALIGLPNLSQKPLNRLPAGAAVVTRKQEQALREVLKHDVAFYERAVAMYSKRTDLLASHKSSAEHPWTRFYS